MGGDRNRVKLRRRDGTQEWPLMGKDAVADKLAALIAAKLVR